MVALKDLSREQDFMEKALTYCERRDIYQCVSVSAKVNKPFDENLAYASLRSLILKYPLLFSFSAGSECQERFEPLDKIGFKEVFEADKIVTRSFMVDDAEAKGLSSACFHENLHKRGPLWKFTYYEYTDWVTLQISHIISDGGSAVAYLKDFVEGLNTKTNATAEPVLFCLEDDLPNLEHAITPRIFSKVQYQPGSLTKIAAKTLKYLLKMFPGYFVPLLDKQHHNSLFVNCPPVTFSKELFFESEHLISADSPLNKTVPMFINLNPEILGRILQKCREKGVKLSSYLIVVYIHTVHQMLPGVYEDKFLRVGVATSLRNVFPGLQSHNAYLGGK